ncbi:MAG: DUF1223 domain-containing protein [Ginsengibacter sp.]
MKLITLVALSLCLMIYGFTSIRYNPREIRKPSPTAKIGFAVVELFTSEGCSSCPPADQVIAKIQQEDSNQPVYILAFHVDYWNNSAWKDVFSSAAYSKRQSEYANWLNLTSVYTPQIVVNGKKEFVGSQEGVLRSEIKNKLDQPGRIFLRLEDLKMNGTTANFSYHSESNSSDLHLQVALVQKSGETYVKRGENGGRTLSHIQIVKRFESLNLNGKNIGNIKIDIPSELKNQKLEVIAFLQNTRNGEIVAATKSDL